ncbi:membrane-spanning 4-domains subfamily A member 4D-like isoform X2 [Oxyura jamaicensis]|uniref:membrane-spanning 4-domains subfamily A member 4D-like isoform X2 n=1 Tax=Oxyura jamaicensis TaxID=8884 RepID=UPI0015A5E2E4|nr:membrane-spanning 4-domains subfamily A member 4D-like isoform X2 [Oxyura jamaicensis]
MSKLPAGNKGQRGRAPRPAGALQTPGGTRTAGSGQEQQGEPGLSEAMAATVTDSGGVRIITEVIPATDPRAAQLASSSVPPAPAVSSFQVRGFRKAQPKLLGTIHIVTGIIHFCFGIILTAAEHRDLSLPVASGILFWLGVLLLVSGSLLVESDKRENILLPAAAAMGPVQVKACCVVNVGVILSTLVATLIHAAAITRSIPGCDGGAPYQLRQEWCFNANTKVLSNALDAVAVLFCLLEFCAAVAALAFGCAAVRRHSYTRMAL